MTPDADQTAPGDAAVATPPVDPNSGALWLIDGSAFVFRAFHAMAMLTRPDGTPVNAVYGFCNMVWRLMESFGPQCYAVIFDADRRNFRNDIYPLYKANRSEPPDELKPQFPLVRDATRAFGLPCVEVEGYEADDLIATYARLATAAGRDTVIVSSDKDLMQLVGDHVVMWDPMKQARLGIADVIEKFGVPPHRVVDVQALAGDSIDNVPGVPGIGLKTAAQLIVEHGDLETLLANAAQIKQQKRRENLIQYADQARVSRRLVELDAHAPVQLSDVDQPHPDPGALLRFLRQQNFRSLAVRVREAFARQGVEVPEDDLTAGDAGGTQAGGDAAGFTRSRLARAAPSARPISRGGPEVAEGDRPGQPPVVAATEYHLVQDLAALEAWVAEARAAGVVGFDTETTSTRAATTRLCGVSLATRPGRACYIPLAHVVARPAELDLSGATAAAAPTQVDSTQALALLKTLLEDPAVLKVGHNLKFDLQVMAGLGITVAPIDDTMLMSYVLHGRAHDQGLDFLAGRYLNLNTITFEAVAGKGKAQVTFDCVPVEQARDYAAEDADIALRFAKVFRPRLVQQRLTSLYERIERPLIAVVAAMERRGVIIDPGVLKVMSGRFAEQIAGLEAEIHRMAGRSFNVGSPKQLGEVLFEELGLPTGTMTKTKQYSTASDVLEPLAEQGHEIVEKVLEWRSLTKLKSTYTDALQNEIDPATGRVHTCFQLAATNTGRLSSIEPNLQNIPIRTEEGRRIRNAFVAPPGHVLLSVDYSQIELRLVAEMAGVAALQEAFRNGIDIHAATASQVFGVPLDQMTPEIRRKAKAINFGIIYGISAYGLGRQLNVSQGEAGAFIKGYLSRFHEIQTYMEEAKERCRTQGYVETLFGRRCYIPEITDRNRSRRLFAERQAINAPIQGTAADIMKRAMIAVDAMLRQTGSPARMLLQVHDELVFEVPEAAAPDAAAAIRATMEAAARLSVPLVAEAGWGAHWAAAH